MKRGGWEAYRRVMLAHLIYMCVRVCVCRGGGVARVYRAPMLHLSG